MSPLIWTGVVLLGGAGAVLRHLVDRSVSARFGRGFPFGILVVNLTGSLALGLVTGLALSHDHGLMAGTAAIGSYTTFSTWMLDSARLGGRGRPLALMANIGFSLVAGLLAVAAGRSIGGLL